MEETRNPSGLNLLHCVLKDKNWNILSDNDISDSDFTGDALVALNFVREYYNKYNEFPDVESVTNDTRVIFPRKEAPPVAYAVEVFHKHILSKKLSTLISDASKQIVNGNPQSAYSEIVSGISQIKPIDKAKSFKLEADTRFEEYKKKKLTGVRGITPPWPTLKDAIAVWENGTFNVLLGTYSTGKAQPYDEPVLTEEGWTPIGKLEVGDKVYGPTGNLATIIQTHPQGKINVYRVWFSDGTCTRCCENHLWEVTYNIGHTDEERTEVRSLKSLIGDYNLDLKRFYKYRIKCNDPLPAIPQSYNRYLTLPLDERRAEFSELVNDVGYMYDRVLALPCVNKHVVAMARSLGFLVSERLMMTLVTGDFASLSLDSRFDNLPSSTPSKAIISIEQEDPEFCKCITLDSEDQLYLTRDFTVTHNSWACSVAALHAAFTQDKKVLMVTMENSKQSIESRLDALYHKVPFSDLRQGWVDMRTESKWKESKTTLKQEAGDIIVADGNMVREVGDILQLVMINNPDFVVVDGAYKLESKGKDMFEKSSKLLQDFHHFAELTKVPWLASSQLNPSADGTKSGKDAASQARGNKNWSIDAATVLTLTQSNDQRLLNVVECRIAKIREVGDTAGLDMVFLMKQDRQKMLFDEVIENPVNTEILDSILQYD